MLVLLSTEFGIIVSYRIGRYDGMGFLILALTLCAFTITSVKSRMIFLFVLYLFVPWAGLQFGPMEFTLALVAVILFRSQFWKEIVVSFAASGIGVLLFFTGLWSSGRLPVFMELVHVQQLGFIGNLLKGRFDHHNAVPADYSLFFIFAAAVVMLAASHSSESNRAFLTLRFAFVFTICLAIVLISTSKFPTYYTYMITIPLTIGIFAGLSVCKNKRHLITVSALCAMSSFVGVGAHLIVYSVDSQDRDYGQLVQYVDQTIRPDDVVFADPATYFAAIGRAHEIYMPLSDWDIIERMSDDEKKSVNVLLVRQGWLDRAVREFGGQWKATGQDLVPSGHVILGGNVNLGFLTIPDNHLMILRRQ